MKPIVSFYKKVDFWLLYLYDKQNNTWLLADMELLFSCSTRYQEITAVYILLLDILLVRWSHSWDSELNTRREIASFSTYWMRTKWLSLSYSLNAKSLNFNEFQCVSVARSLSDWFSSSPAIIDCWPQKRLLMNVKPLNLIKTSGLELFDCPKVCCVVLEL